MSAFLRRWGALGGAALIGACIGAVSLGLTRCDRAIEKAEARGSQQATTEGRLKSTEARATENYARLLRVERGVDALLLWARMVSRAEGWEPPPEPAGMSVGPAAECGSGSVTQGFIAGTRTP